MFLNKSFRSLWNTPRAAIFNTKIILVHFESKETLFSPIGTPRISNNPIFFSFSRLAPADNGNIVIRNRNSYLFAVNATSVVVFKVISSINSARNRTSRIDFIFHLLHTSEMTKFSDFPFLVRIFSLSGTSSRNGS